MYLEREPSSDRSERGSNPVTGEATTDRVELLDERMELSPRDAVASGHRPLSILQALENATVLFAWSERLRYVPAVLPVVLGGGRVAPLRFLCLGAHSDDLEIGCGGTIERLLAERPGSEVDWIVWSASGEREREARASAIELTAAAARSDVVTKAFRDGHFPASIGEMKDCFEALARTIRPDIIFTHHRGDGHQDHRTVAELTWSTFRDHLICEYEIAKYDGDLATPTLYAPLSLEQAERKVDHLFRHFGSQSARPWFRADAFHGLMALRGIECRAPAGRAEAFYVRKIVL